MTSVRGGASEVLNGPFAGNGPADLDGGDLVDLLASRLSSRGISIGGNDDCGLDADCPPDQICLDGHCT